MKPLAEITVSMQSGNSEINAGKILGTQNERVEGDRKPMRCVSVYARLATRELQCWRPALV
jgi:hypothetical protein